MAEPQIIIRREPFGIGFDITVEPKPAWTSFNCERPTLHAARRYAEGLHTVHGWRIRDETGEAV
ncbi:hypothetical protein [Sphingomonas oligoaromativorans]|uniref:hypothetical protein n=1 Tax=Sphingomonas oligoaromativorans TaxID=575322 RepID=UPI00141D8A12|nr:hypothetical protein [Sphingomonas oligoaromativorans]NIJ32790.1 hypothetical protein [Sphingomonas oligoaromativorans]